MRYRLMCWVVSSVLSIGTGVCFAQNLKQDTVLKAASEQYNNTSFLGRFLMGSNYRNVWSTPVSMPVFRLSQQGFTIKELGGGQQTKSLRIVDKNKREWVLRTVDKDAEGAVPEKFRVPFVV